LKKQSPDLPPRRPTVLDVAQLARVGASTVSRYLRGGNNVSHDVSLRVAEAVRKLGYQPDELARGLRGGRTHTIGVIFPQTANSFFGRCVQMIEQEAAARGCAVILHTHNESPELQSRQLATLRRYRADGVILTCAPGSDLHSLQKELTGIPLVALDRPLWDEADAVLLRNREASRMAVEHLLSHGHTAIACITAAAHMYTFSERVAGYREVIAGAGLREHLIVADNYEQLQGAVGRALDGRDAPTALFSLSNMATFSVLLSLTKAHHKVSRELALIGFDDVDYASLLNPSLTTIRQPIGNLSQQAVQLLFDRILYGDKRQPERIMLPGELVRRHSCGCRRVDSGS